MSEQLNDTVGVESPITDADIAAFRVGHALDSHEERIAKDFGNGQYIVEEKVIFEIFSFNAEDVGEIIFDVRGIKDALADRKFDFKMFDTPLVEGWINHIRDKGGVEVERMKQLTAADLERPPIAVYWPNGYTTVIDGNNRMVRRWDDGLRMVRMAVIVLNRKMLPYMCRPGQEEIFLRRRSSEDPRGMQPLAWKNLGVVGGLE